MARWLPKEVRKRLPERIGYLREKEGLTIAEIAERLNISAPRATFYWNKYKKKKGMEDRPENN